jgi:hypothetical protein
MNDESADVKLFLGVLRFLRKFSPIGPLDGAFLRKMGRMRKTAVLERF